jgi:thiol-disulfide isomerase/thioredoxin
VSEKTTIAGEGVPGDSAGESIVESESESDADRLGARWLGLVLDLVVGFCTLILALVVVSFFYVVGFRQPAVVAGSVFFVAALVRAIWSKTNPWGEGAAIALGAFFPAALIAIAAFHGGQPRMWSFGAALVLICGGGAQTQRFLKRRNWAASAGTTAALVVVLFVLGKFVAPRLMAPFGPHTMNEPAPRFTVTMLDGTPVTLDSLKGRVVVLDFWGTWCAPCMAEMPTIAKVHRQFQSNANVVVLAVNPGWHEDTADTVRTFVARKRLDLPVALDDNGAWKLMKVEALPTLMVIDRQGHIRMEETGYDEDEPLETDLTGEIESLLKN